MTSGETFSCHEKKTLNNRSAVSLRWTHERDPNLPTSSDDLVVDVSDDHGVDHGDTKHPGQDPLQDVKPDIRTGRKQRVQVHSFSPVSQPGIDQC